MKIINIKLKKKTLIKLNFKTFKPLIKILPKISLRLLGFMASISMKKKNILMYLKVIKNSSSYLIQYLVDIAVLDYP